MSSVCLYAGHFLLPEKNESEARRVKQAFPVKYEKVSFTSNGRKQQGNILEIDVSGGNAEVKPVLSYDSVFGYESLSSIASRTNAYAAVNAGFFYLYGLPAGMVMIDGELIRNSTGDYPVLAIEGNKASLKELRTNQYLVCGKRHIKLDGVNSQGEKGKTVLYTKWYGSSNRAQGKNITVTIVDGKVADIGRKSGETDIPDNGMLLTVYGDSLQYTDLKQGDEVKFEYSPYLGKKAQCYECGSWIVRNGKVVIGKYDKWIGITTNNDPRTAVGIDKSGKIILLTVDGRQPGYSYGMTGKELGQFLLSKGIENAAMLDGGASTEMIVKGKIVNRPSYGGQERPLGGGLVVKVRDGK